MIDLIDECSYDFLKLGYSKKKAKKYNIDLLSLHVKNKKQAKNLGFDIGDYYIIHAPVLNYLDKECFDYVSNLLLKRFRYLLKEKKLKNLKTLIVGLGNPEIWADRLGNEVCNKIAIDNLSNVCKICPNVYLQTNIKTFDIVESLVKSLGIKLVIIIDSLCTNSLSRLGCSLQLTTTGMTPGSAMNSGNKRLCEKEIGVPCLAIGVPLLINTKSLGFDEEFLLAPKDVKENIENLAYIISKALMEGLR